MRRALASLTVILLLSLPLAGCGGAPQTTTEPQGTPGVEATGSDTPTESVPNSVPPAGEGSGLSSPSANDPALAALVKERCTRCHDVSRIEAVQGRDVAGWQQTIERMRGRGAQLTDDEARQVAEYFAAGGNKQLE